jgi:hypothetical protein
VHHVVAAQVGFESKISKQFMIFQFQALRSRRFQREFDMVNQHRPTMSDENVIPIAAPAATAAAARCCAASEGEVGSAEQKITERIFRISCT